MKTFRKHDERFLQELAEIHHEKEELMLTEMENVGKDKDLGWDDLVPTCRLGGDIFCRKYSMLDF